MKPIKFGSVAEIRKTSKKRLKTALVNDKLVIKIRPKTKNDEIARIFRVLGSVIDEIRKEIEESKYLFPNLHREE